MSYDILEILSIETDLFVPVTVNENVINDFQQSLQNDLDDIFIDEDTFGESFSYYYSILDQWDTTLIGLVDIPSDTNSQTHTQGEKPQIQVASHKLLETVRVEKDRILCRNKTYIVKKIDHDGVGVTTISVSLG